MFTSLKLAAAKGKLMENKYVQRAAVFASSAAIAVATSPLLKAADPPSGKGLSSFANTLQEFMKNNFGPIKIIAITLAALALAAIIIVKMVVTDERAASKYNSWARRVIFGCIAVYCLPWIVNTLTGIGKQASKGEDFDFSE